MKLAETVRKARRATQARRAKRKDKYVQKHASRAQPGRQGQRLEDGTGGGS